MSSDPATSKPPRLIFSLALFAGTIAAALAFGSAFETAPSGGVQAPEKHSHEEAAPSHHTNHAAAPDTGPMYFAGGVYSPKLGLAGLADAVQLMASPGGGVPVQSLRWHDGELLVIDLTPPMFGEVTTIDGATKQATVTIDHAGPDITPEFATAIQSHVGTLTQTYHVQIFPPLPGLAERGENEFPYDWTFLDSGDKVDVVDWDSVEPIESDRMSLAERTFRGRINPVPSAPAQGDQPITELLDRLVGISAVPVADQRPALTAARTRMVLGQMDPYDVVPVMQRWIDAAALGQRDQRVYEALMLCRIWRIHPLDLLDEAIASENAGLRTLAARYAGEYPDQAKDPIGTLTLLAEDKDMRVRQAALASCLGLGGRRAAGVAQLVEAYEMNDVMRALYAPAMKQLMTYGQPVMADSRANRLRRMPIDELLNQERDALVCRILLEREDLPDDKIEEVLGQLAEANGRGPLVALLNLLETMNPRTVSARPALLRLLVKWKTNELNAQQDRLVELVNLSGPIDLRAAATGALIRALAEPAKVAEAIGERPILFAGLRWVEEPAIRKTWGPIVAERTVSGAGANPEMQIAALDALALIPDENIKPVLGNLLETARESGNLDLRFAAIRAINALPDALRPGDIDDLKLTSLTLKAVPGKIAFDLEKLTAIAGRPVEIKLINPDTMQHNFAITKPGRMQEVGLAITTMNPADAAAINYVPQSDAVLWASEMLNPGQTTTLRFVAPDQPGTYPYVCTFPGHYTSMNGEIEFVAP